jgi:hypothetical protein
MDTEVEDPKVMLNRRRTRLGAVVVGATLLSGAGAALSACSSGQITQTAGQVAAVPGENVDSPDGQVGLRNGVIVYAPKYEPNEAIPLDLRLVNNGTEDVRLTGAVTADGNGTVVLVGGASPSSSPTSAPPSSPPSPSTSPSSSRSGSPSSSRSGSPSSSRSASPSSSPAASPSSASPSPSSEAGSASFNVDVPLGQLVILSPGQPNGSYLMITKRSSGVVPGMTVGVNFTFTYASGKSVVLSANLPVGVPLSPPTQEPPASA